MSYGRIGKDSGRQGSNLRPPAPKAGALPLRYAPCAHSSAVTAAAGRFATLVRMRHVTRARIAGAVLALTGCQTIREQVRAVTDVTSTPLFASTGHGPVDASADASTPPAPAANALTMAVMDLSAEGTAASDAAVITEMLRTKLARTGAFRVVEKKAQSQLLGEQAFQQTGCTTEECAVKLGRLLNVQRMVVGSFGKLLDSYFVNVRVVSVETGQVVYADSARGNTAGELETAVQTMSGRFPAGVK